MVHATLKIRDMVALWIMHGLPSFIGNEAQLPSFALRHDENALLLWKKSQQALDEHAVGEG